MIIKASDGAVVLVPARAERLNVTIANYSALEFRFTLGNNDLPTQTHGLRLGPGEVKNANGVLNFDHKDAVLDAFVEDLSVILIGDGEAQIDFVEVFDVP